MSTPSDRPNRRSSASFGVIADAGSWTPGALMPLCSPISPPSITVVWISCPSVASTRSSTSPSASNSRSPGLTLGASPANVVEMRPGPPMKSPGRDGQPVAGLDGERPPALELAGANLRPAEILENRHLAARALGRRPHPRERRAMRLVRAVREIQTEDVGAGGDERVEDGVGVARRADGRDDLGVSHVA